MSYYQKAMQTLWAMSDLGRELCKIDPSHEPDNFRVKIDEYRVMQRLFLENGNFLNTAIKNKTLSLSQVEEINMHFQINNVVNKHIEKVLIQPHRVTVGGKNLHFTDINSYLDVKLPKTWHFDVDVIVISTEHEDIFLDALISRGQKRIIVFADVTEYKDNIQYIAPKDANKAFDNFGLLKPKRLCFLSQSAGYFSKRDDYLEFCDSLSVELRQLLSLDLTIRNNSKTWAFNTINNLNEIRKSKSAWELQDCFAGKNVVVVSPGPSLSGNIAFLKEIKDTVVIAVAQAVPALKEAGIIPKFVLVLDPLDYSHCLEGAAISKMNLISPEYISKSFVNSEFHEKYFLLSNKGIVDLNALFNTPCFDLHGASSVSVAAVLIAYQLKAAKVALVGQDLSYQLGKIYTGDYKGIDDPYIEHGIELPGYYGSTVPSRADYAFYHHQFQELAKKIGNDINLYNCTEGGANIIGFQNMDLTTYLDLKSDKNPPKNITQFVHNSDRVFESYLERLITEAEQFQNLIEKWMKNRSNHLSGSKNSKLEIEIFTLASQLEVIHYALYQPFIQFGEACILGFSNEVAEIQKQISINEMLEGTVELISIYKNAIIELENTFNV